MKNIPTQPRKPLIAAILPAYNEEGNVGAVLEVLRATELLDEIILVDDGSTDRTVDLLRQFAERDRRARLICHETNMGKGQAIFTGWAATSAPYIIMLDTDLKNLHPEHVTALIEPVLNHRAEMTLGLFVGGHLATDFSHWATPFLTGQRGMRADLLKHVSRQAAAGYGFEVALTIAAGQNGYRTRIVPLKGVWHPPSEFHRGLRFGVPWRLHMYGQIGRAWYIATSERYPKMREFFSSRSNP
ncbi:MAG: glycosyl transferase [Anaerolineaceae bacterium]|nr:MAG: glycosyl transferase [Anaerolineaceae bacterium]